MEEVTQGTSTKKVTKKKPAVNSVEQRILSKMVDTDKSEITLSSDVKIKKSFVDALNVFSKNPEHLAIVLEEALSAINVIKLADEYSKKVKNQD